MRKKFILLALSIFILNILVTTMVYAADYEEVTYEDLISRLSKKKNNIQSSTSKHALDDIMLHAGAGLVTSVTTVRINDKITTRQQNGFQISMGIDLFSEHWAAEGIIYNYGTDTSGTETRSLREVDMKVIYRNKTTEQMGYRFGAGLSTRTLKISDNTTGVNINDTTPAWVGTFGLDSYLNKHLSIGAGISLKSAMISDTADKNAFGFGLNLNSYF